MVSTVIVSPTFRVTSKLRQEHKGKGGIVKLTRSGKGEDGEHLGSCRGSSVARQAVIPKLILNAPCDRALRFSPKCKEMDYVKVICAARHAIERYKMIDERILALGTETQRPVAGRLQNSIRLGIALANKVTSCP